MKTCFYETKFLYQKQDVGFIRSIDELEAMFNNDKMCSDRYHILAQCAKLIETREERLRYLQMVFLSYNFMKCDMHRSGITANRFANMYYKILRVHEITDSWEDEWIEIIQQDPGKYVGWNKSLKMLVELIRD